MYKEAEVELLNKVRQGLTEQCDELPDVTLRKLDVMRSNALNASAPKQRFLGQGLLGIPFVPLSAALSAGVLGVALLMTQGSDIDIEKMVSDEDVLMSNEDMEFLENLELYEWLDAEYG
ncbi:MAG: Unknown protein [uncultured Thiotrichaceae bacterium]|uniref:Uncharacterized protein n=1 Tax=uncultured Thiotrichaceae bacterium TaxID=298394 RepID=A0A6S6TL38_9GAMM|nr:MAG: Unknown protein [uncultured Thiotrichaceae bacterium]